MRGFRKLVMGLVELLQVINIVVWTIGGGVIGYRLGHLWNFGNQLQGGMTIKFNAPEDLGMIIGAFIGFSLSATAAAFMFTLSQIEANTYEASRFYQMMRDKQMRSEPSVR